MQLGRLIRAYKIFMYIFWISINSGIELALSACPLFVCCNLNWSLSLKAILLKLTTHASYWCTAFISRNHLNWIDISYGCQTKYQPIFVIWQDFVIKFTTSNIFYLYDMRKIFHQNWTTITYVYLRKNRPNSVFCMKVTLDFRINLNQSES